MPKEKNLSKTAKSSKTGRPTEEAFAAYRPKQLEDLRSALPIFYMTLAWTYLDGGGELNGHIINSYLPGRTFELAQSCGLISASEGTFSILASEQVETSPVAIPDGFLEPDETLIGMWCVKKRFQEVFFRLLQPALSQAGTIAAANATAQWHKPTPAVRVKAFLDEMRWTKVRLIGEMLSKSKGAGDDAAKKQLAVITKEPLEPNRLKNYHVVLSDVMREHSPSCSDLKPLDLVWRYRS